VIRKDVILVILCDKNFNSMIRSSKYVVQNTAADLDALSSKILEECKRYLENPTKIFPQSERAHIRETTHNKTLKY